MLNKMAVLIQRLTTYNKSEQRTLDLMRSPRRFDDSVASGNSEIRWQRVPPIRRHPKIRQHLRKLFERMDRHARVDKYTKYMHT
jgi:hypothetical protein